MDEKKCFKCGETKQISEFYKHKQMADGHLNKCKSCTKIDVHSNYSDNRQYYAEYEKARFQTPERKAAAIGYQRIRRAVSPQKYKARNLVGNSKRDGKINEIPCLVCGCLEVEAHHSDYNDPLNVVWLCRTHHLLEHEKTTYNV